MVIQLNNKINCLAFAFNKDSQIFSIGFDNQIIIYKFKQRIQKQIQVLLYQHKNDVFTLNFLKKSNQLISGEYDSTILIRSINNKNQWVCSQTIKGHYSSIYCLIINNNEDLFISGKADKTIKFCVKKNKWICSQTITDYQNSIYSLSLNDQQNYYSAQNKNWIVIQKTNVDCYGFRLCFVDDNLFKFQSIEGNLMHVYEMNSVRRQFSKTKDIIINQGNDSEMLFPQQYIKSKQLLVNKHDKYINFIRLIENEEFKLEQKIQFSTKQIFGSLSDDRDYLITQDSISTEIQIRECREE
ncbi:unnamed protein product [Paramecium sonneborni]|uniref:Uncharacterized protein n=1 Tax=Paramecium sonneborni TaxID=65129 RepID=A0A8S1RPI6_9CILI|nr:unnamed protein product [Paramecium sonneborni]